MKLMKLIVKAIERQCGIGIVSLSKRWVFGFSSFLGIIIFGLFSYGWAFTGRCHLLL
jgi:hypothetical protein